MKLSKDELIAKINGYEIDDNIKIELIEDVTDSFDTSETDELKTKYEELKQKYKDRFLKGEETEKETKDETDNPEMEEKKVIDVKEI